MASERILVVDDEPEIVRLCVFILEDEGYEATGVTNGEEALAQLESGSFDLLIADIKMPEMDGLELLRRARDIDPNLTTVIVTGYATMDRAIEALNSGARGFVMKPFGFDEFASAVDTAVTQKRQEQERLRLRAQLPILEVSQALMGQADMEALSAQLLEIVVRQVGSDRGVLALFDEAQGHLETVAAVGLLSAVVGRCEEMNEGGLLKRAFDAEGVVVQEELAHASGEPLIEALTAGPERVSLVLVPLRTGRKTVGVLGLGFENSSHQREVLSQSDVSLLQIMAGQVAIALENKRMYALEQQRTEALAHALEQQRELDRIMGEFMRNVSHELRTPLSMILGYSELLSSGALGELSPKQRGPLEIIEQRAYALRDLVDNITAILENESRMPWVESVQLRPLVEEALADFQLLADQAGLSLQGEIAEEELQVLGDARHLRRMVDNLISNALKFTPAGGLVTVGLHASDGQAVLRVADSGIGIPAEHLDRIFERFFQVDGTIRRHYGGSGLGLALVKEIVEAHGGMVTVESQIDRGSIFEIRLPLMRNNQQEGKSPG